MPSLKDALAVLDKACPQADRRNMVYSSTTVISGNGTAIVTETGMDTKVGKIAYLLEQEESPQTPLQQRLAKVGKALGIGAVGICLLVFLLGIIRKSGILPSFMLSVSLAVAAIPEGLPAVVTVVLSMGVQRLAKSNAIIRSLPAVETLGTATVICSDKTGTLTQNKMTVTEICTPTKKIRADEAESKRILQLASVCCNAEMTTKRGKAEFSGDPTETAILAAAHSNKIDFSRQACPRHGETPFSGERKRMSALHTVDGRDLLIIKGAPDVVLGLCEKVLINGDETPLTQEKRKRIISLNEDMANRALRVISVAFRKAADKRDLKEEGFVFVGMLGMTDPPRPEAAKAVSVCKKAGIAPAFISIKY